MSDEQLVRLLDDQERSAALKRDVAALERLWSEDFTVNAPNNQVVSGRRLVLSSFIDSGAFNYSIFDRKIEYLRIDRDFAVIMGLETLLSDSDGTVKRRYTNIWKNEGGAWRLFARHANVIPNR